MTERGQQRSGTPGIANTEGEIVAMRSSRGSARPTEGARRAAVWPTWPGADALAVRQISALSRLKMEVFTPMPSASVITAAAVKPGLRHNWRVPYFRSCQTDWTQTKVACTCGSPSLVVSGDWTSIGAAVFPLPLAPPIAEPEGVCPDRYRPDHCPQCEAYCPLTAHGFYAPWRRWLAR